MNRFYRAAGIAVTLIAAAFFVAYAVRNADELPAYRWSSVSVASLIGASFVYLGVTVIAGLAWHLLLAGSGGSPGIGTSFTILSLSQIAKYLPGNVGHHVGRIALSTARGLPVPRVLLTMAVEAGWLILASALLGLGWLFFAEDRTAISSTLAPQGWIIIVFGIAAVIAPLAAGWIFPRVLPRIYKSEERFEETWLPDFTTLVAVLALYGVSFLIVGGILGVLLRAFYGINGGNLLFHTGLFSLAWVAGFLTPGAPAGLGIREAILVAVLGATYGAGIAVGLTLLLRMVTLGGDGLAFAGGVLARRALW